MSDAHPRSVKYDNQERDLTCRTLNYVNLNPPINFGRKFVQIATSNLTTDITTVSYAPAFDVLRSVTLTVTTGTQLFIMFTGAWRHTGVAGRNIAMNFRLRVDTVVQQGGTTTNALTNAIQPTTLSRLVSTSAGAHTIDIQWGMFGPAGQTGRVSVATLPDLNHATLTVFEIE